MAMPGYGVYDTEAQEIENRRRYAEALRQQGMQPLETQMAGRVAIPISWAQGAAKLLQGYAGSKGVERAGEERKTLAERRSQAMADALKGMPQARQETTQTPFNMASVGQDMPGEAPIPGLANQQTRTVQPTMQDRAAWMGQLAQVGPEAVSMGGTLMGMQARQDETAENRAFRQQESDAARAARAQELQLRLQDARLSAQDRAELQRELAQMQIQARQDMVRLAAQMRPGPQPQPAQIIQTDTGIYERTRDGQLRPLTDPATGKPLQPKAPGNAKGKTEVQSTMDLYTAASEGLISGLAGTSTGPIAGKLPAVTTGQQVAEGGVAAMAPVLKQIFRVAGEGTFTDKDQELLLNMVPKRTDTPAAAQEKIKNIDNIVSAKLGLPPPERSWDESVRGKIGASDRRQTPRQGSNRIVVDY